MVEELLHKVDEAIDFVFVDLICPDPQDLHGCIIDVSIHDVHALRDLLKHRNIGNLHILIPCLDFAQSDILFEIINTRHECDEMLNSNSTIQHFIPIGRQLFEFCANIVHLLDVSEYTSLILLTYIIKFIRFYIIYSVFAEKNKIY